MRSFAAILSRVVVAVSLILLCGYPASKAAAQALILGSNHPELSWHQIETDHFVLIYHDGLDSIVHAAAPMAEEVYRVVTTNLQTPLAGRLKVYFSDNDEVKNAFAFSDDHIFIWMRGILDDLPLGIRASGTSKWLRSVITHEFTHIVIAHATRDWSNIILPAEVGVPSWFNEGMARFMEPDGWTNDLDMALRTSVVSSKLDFDLDQFLGGTLLYEGGQSLVRYIARTFGDTTLANILKYRDDLGLYNFEEGVQHATKKSLHEISEGWRKTLNVYYSTQYGQRQETVDYGREVPSGLDVVLSARLDPKGSRIAVAGKRNSDAGGGLYLISNDTSGDAELLTNESGIDPYISWNPDGSEIAYAKLRFGEHNDLIYDLYRYNVNEKYGTRITTDGRFEQPDWSPDGKSLVAVHAVRSGSDLYRIDVATGAAENLTNFNDRDVEVYWPRWSHDGSKIAFSIFRKNGMRDVVVLDVATRALNYLTSDSLNDRYTVWSPNDNSIAFTSFRNKIPNVYRLDGLSIGSLRQLTDEAGAVFAWDWSAKKSDSILVTSFEDRTRIKLFWIPAEHTVEPKPLVTLDKKYTDWREVHWPLITRPLDSLSAVNTSEVSGYNSLAHIAPLAFLPMAGSDRSKSNEPGTRYGLIGIASDPMSKHSILAFADYGDASNRFSYALQYINSQLKPSLIFGAADLLQFAGLLSDKVYFERQRSYNAGLVYPITSPNSLTTVHDITIGATYRQLDPWNDSNFTTFDVTRKPVQAKLMNLMIGYGYHARDAEATIDYTHADRKIASDLTYNRYHFFGTIQMPLGESRESFFALIGHGVAQWGEELPQEIIGFSPYDIFEGGFNITNAQSTDRLRGIRRYYYGNRLLIGSAELRMPDEIVSNIVPLLKAFDPSLVEFFDIGSTWYGSRPWNNPSVQVLSLKETKWLKTAGVELRSQLSPGSWFGGGVGWELVKGSHPDWFFRTNIMF